ncbi:hypothetical protein NC651_028926 [Populus alba x Populus x berolinensis]|nr:hypothetical protein NC651_028926 [Populus alba x Populus x berolinensis]
MGHQLSTFGLNCQVLNGLHLVDEALRAKDMNPAGQPSTFSCQWLTGDALTRELPTADEFQKPPAAEAATTTFDDIEELRKQLDVLNADEGPILAFSADTGKLSGEHLAEASFMKRAFIGWMWLKPRRTFMLKQPEQSSATTKAPTISGSIFPFDEYHLRAVELQLNCRVNVTWHEPPNLGFLFS